MNALRIAVLSAAGLLALSGAGRIFTAAPPDVRPVGFSCPTERRLYCDPDMTMCHSERDVIWSTEPCTRPADANLPNLTPRPVFRCEDGTHGVWYSWAPCDQEPDPIEVF